MESRAPRPENFANPLPSDVSSATFFSALSRVASGDSNGEGALGPLPSRVNSDAPPSRVDSGGPGSSSDVPTRINSEGLCSTSPFAVGAPFVNGHVNGGWAGPPVVYGEPVEAHPIAGQPTKF